MKKLGYKEAECVVKAGLTEEQKRKYRLLDNKTNELAEWDLDLLTDELDGLDFDGFDFGFGIDDDEPEEVVEDDYDAEPPVEPKAKLGDIFQLGRHRLMCGDSTKAEDVEKLMEGQKADMVFTDPPYGYSYKSNMRGNSQKFDVIENDDRILDFFPQVKDNCDGFVFSCCSWKNAEQWITVFKKYFELTNVIVWDKGGGGIGDLAHTFSTDYELILVANQGNEIKGKRYGSVWNFTKSEISNMEKDELISLFLEMRKFSDVWQVKKDNAVDYVHPTQKPIALSARAIRSTTEFSDIVLDLFGGSGSTLIASEQLDRSCYMMELGPRYVDVIIDRWEKFTGEKAVKLN